MLPRNLAGAVSFFLIYYLLKQTKTQLYQKFIISTSGLWAGLVPRIVMIGTLTAAQWFIYDAVKVFFRMPRPPPPEMPESLKKKMGLA